MPRATTEKFDRPPPEKRFSRPNSGLPCEERGELLPVDARHRHGGQEPEDDEQAEDDEDPAPDIRRPEGVQQGFEHEGLGVVAGRRRGVVGASRRPRPPCRMRRRRPRRSASAAGRRLVGTARPRRARRRRRLRPRRPVSTAAVLGAPRPRRRVSGGVGLGRRRPRSLRRRAGSAASVGVRGRWPSVGLVGTSRTDTVPPAASILVRADAVNASATTNSGEPSSPSPRILSGLFRLRTSPTARRMSWLTVTWPPALRLALRPRPVPRPRARRARRRPRWRRRSRPRTRS